MKICIPTYGGGLIEFDDKWKFIDYLWEKEEEYFKKFHLDMDRKEYYCHTAWYRASEDPMIYTEYDLMELNVVHCKQCGKIIYSGDCCEAGFNCGSGEPKPESYFNESGTFSREDLEKLV